MFHKLSTLSDHCQVLFPAIAEGNDDVSFETSESCCHCHTLTVIAACRCDNTLQARIRLFKPIHIDKGATQFERADRRVVLVLDPRFHTDPLVDQRPSVLWSWWHMAVDD